MKMQLLSEGLFNYHLLLSWCTARETIEHAMTKMFSSLLLTYRTGILLENSTIMKGCLSIATVVR